MQKFQLQLYQQYLDASRINDSERNPPAISIGIDTEETIFFN